MEVTFFKSGKDPRPLQDTILAAGSLSLKKPFAPLLRIINVSKAYMELALREQQEVFLNDNSSSIVINSISKRKESQMRISLSFKVLFL